MRNAPPQLDPAEEILYLKGVRSKTVRERLVGQPCSLRIPRRGRLRRPELARIPCVAPVGGLQAPCEFKTIGGLLAHALAPSRRTVSKRPLGHERHQQQDQPGCKDHPAHRCPCTPTHTPARNTLDESDPSTGKACVEDAEEQAEHRKANRYIERKIDGRLERHCREPTGASTTEQRIRRLQAVAVTQQKYKGGEHDCEQSTQTRQSQFQQRLEVIVVHEERHVFRSVRWYTVAPRFQ